MKSIAIMQPYFFPYIGYWQLIRAADRFIILDDVNLIRRGWVNRNRLLINGKAAYITAPLAKASQNRLICETTLDDSTPWREKFMRTVMTSYARAPFFKEIFPLLQTLLCYPSANLAAFLTYQIRELSRAMGLETEIVGSSREYANRHLSGQDRILDICREEGANIYLNAPGGRDLYEAAAFRGAGLDLRFVSMRPLPYAQKGTDFVAGLSIIDVLMAVGMEGVRTHLDAFDLCFAGSGGGDGG